MTVLKMNRYNSVSDSVKTQRKYRSRDQLKEHYHLACSLGCYAIAQVYFFALYGRKGCFYHYKCDKGTFYAYEYPPIRI